MVGGNRPIFDETEKSLMNMKADIEDNFRIDGQHPPFYDSDQSTNTPCFWNLATAWGGCSTVHYHVRNEVLDFTARISAFPQINVEGRDQADEAAVEMVLSESTAVLDSVSRGWSASAHGTVNPFGVIGGSISYEENKQNTQSRTVTKDYTRRYSCPPWHRCQLHTWAWHVEIRAGCRRVPILKCSREVKVCEAERLDCPSYKRFADQWCLTAAYSTERCTVRVPLLDRAGNPISEVKRVAWDRRPRFKQCYKNTEYAEISTGELYYPARMLYLNRTVKELGWYLKETSEPPPNIPRPYPCIKDT
ncbi:hypothetical protein CDD83_1798 [Cordyceps sp. RAO-2017]|nr:hypothetical protein CDD83_1798 [Cordyceps sp. RAO-2017]